MPKPVTTLPDHCAWVDYNHYTQLFTKIMLTRSAIKVKDICLTPIAIKIKNICFKTFA